MGHRLTLHAVRQVVSWGRHAWLQQGSARWRYRQDPDQKQPDRRLNWDLRLFPATLTVIAASYCVVALPSSMYAQLAHGSSWLTAGALLCGVLATICARLARQEHEARTALVTAVQQLVAQFTLSAALGCAAFWSATYSALPELTEKARAERGEVQAMVRFDADPWKRPNGFFHVRGTIVALEYDGKRDRASSPVLLVFRAGKDRTVVAGQGEPGESGSVFEVTGKLTIPRGLPTKQSLLLAESKPRVVARGSVGGLDAHRRVFTSTVREIWHSWPDAAALLAGLVIGDRSAQSNELREAMQVAGLSHLTAVSGSNCLLVVLGVMGATRLFRCSREAGAVCGGAALLSFVVMVGAEPSVLRAGIMTALGLVAFFWGRAGRSFTLLCSTVVLLLAVDPWLCVDMGFLLSVAATVGIVTTGKTIYRRFSTALPKSVAAALAIPLAAQLFCAPLTILMSPSVPLYAVPANLVVTPLVSVITVLGLVALVSVSWFPFASHGFLWIAGWGAGAVGTVARIGAALPGASLPWWGGWVGVVALASLVGLVVWCVHSVRGPLVVGALLRLGMRTHLVFWGCFGMASWLAYMLAQWCVRWLWAGV